MGCISLCRWLCYWIRLEGFGNVILTPLTALSFTDMDLLHVTLLLEDLDPVYHHHHHYPHHYPHTNTNISVTLIYVIVSTKSNSVSVDRWRDLNISLKLKHLKNYSSTLLEDLFFAADGRCPASRLRTIFRSGFLFFFFLFFWCPNGSQQGVYLQRCSSTFTGCQMGERNMRRVHLSWTV